MSAEVAAEAAAEAEASPTLLVTPSPAAKKGGPKVEEAAAAAVAQVIAMPLADNYTVEADFSNTNISPNTAAGGSGSTGIGKRKVSKPGRFFCPPPTKRCVDLSTHLRPLQSCRLE